MSTGSGLIVLFSTVMSPEEHVVKLVEPSSGIFQPDDRRRAGCLRGLPLGRPRGPGSGGRSPGRTGLRRRSCSLRSFSSRSAVQ